MKAQWVPHDVRDEIVDYVNYWATKSGLKLILILGWLGIFTSKFYRWRERYGKVNEHNGWIPRDHWLEDWEKQAIIRFHYEHPLDGYRRLAFMLLDEGIVAASPASVYRVLKAAGLIANKKGKPSKKGTGFAQPLAAHDHWHIDVSYINIAGTFYYLCAILDGFSRYIVHWEIRESMKEADIELIVQRAREKFPEARPRIISDNGPQFIAKDFKEFVRICGMTHVRTSPFYPQSNGKIERFHREYKETVVRPRRPQSLEGARSMTGEWIDYYNTVRLHSAIGYIAPLDQLEGRAPSIHAARDQKLEAARERRRLSRQSQKSHDMENMEKKPTPAVENTQETSYNIGISPEDRALLGNNPSAGECLGSVRDKEVCMVDQVVA